MEWHARTWFTPRQKAELWERWKNGQCVADIAQALARRNKSSVYRVATGRQRPARLIGAATHCAECEVSAVSCASP